VTGLFLYLALREVDLVEIGAALRYASPGPLWIALLSVAINVLAKSIRWRMMLTTSGKPIHLSKVLMVILMGQALNLFLPGRAGDVTRAVVVGKTGSGSGFVLGTITLEKVLDLVCYGFLFIWMLLLMPMPSWFQNSGYTLTALAGLLVSGVWLLARFPDRLAFISERLVRWLPQRISEMAISFIHSGLSGLKIVKQPARMLQLALWSAVAWTTAIWTNQLVFQALHLDLPWIAAVFLLVVLQAGISLPTMLGQIGIFQYICVLVLGLFGVSSAVGFSYGVMLQTIVTLPTTILGLVSLFIISLSKDSSRFPHLIEQAELKAKQGYEG
jgi:uncharacterized protein (TIRG00374 family)